MISSETRAQIIAATVLHALVEERGVTLRRVGSRHVALCPFHAEKSPSFTLYQEHFHCFGCGAHGTAVDFVMQQFRFGYVQAVLWLAARAGISIEASSEARQSHQLPRPVARPDVRHELRIRLQHLEVERDTLTVAAAGSHAAQEAVLDDLRGLASHETLLLAALSEAEASHSDQR